MEIDQKKTRETMEEELCSSPRPSTQETIRAQSLNFNWIEHQPSLLNGGRSGENSLVLASMLQEGHASSANNSLFDANWDDFSSAQYRICDEFELERRAAAQPQAPAQPPPLMAPSSSWRSLYQLLKQQELSLNTQLQFSFLMEPKDIFRNPTATIKMNNSGGDRELCSPSTQKPESKPATKRPRVRKEKLGDRITALQQLVSPFGKTDTASVLQEASEHIKFLHEQVSILSREHFMQQGPVLDSMQMVSGMPNLRNGDEGKQEVDLRSRGLCLVPIASTYPAVSNAAAPDFWHPALLGAIFNSDRDQGI